MVTFLIKRSSPEVREIVPVRFAAKSIVAPSELSTIAWRKLPVPESFKLYHLYKISRQRVNDMMECWNARNDFEVGQARSGCGH